MDKNNVFIISATAKRSVWELQDFSFLVYVFVADAIAYSPFGLAIVC